MSGASTSGVSGTTTSGGTAGSTSTGGLSGTSGVSGTIGRSGTIGLSGVMGASGTEGLSLAAGISGITGGVTFPVGDSGICTPVKLRFGTSVSDIPPIAGISMPIKKKSESKSACSASGCSVIDFTLLFSFNILLIFVFTGIRFTALPKISKAPAPSLFVPYVTSSFP